MSKQQLLSKKEMIDQAIFLIEVLYHHNENVYKAIKELLDCVADEEKDREFDENFFVAYDDALYRPWSLDDIKKRLEALK